MSLPDSPFKRWPRLRRRRFLVASLITTGAATVWDALRAVAGPLKPSRDPLASLAAFLDTLIPADDSSPGAGEVGVAWELIRQGQSRSRLGQLLRRGCAWLDREAVALGGVDFDSLGRDQREAVVRRAAEAERRSLPRVFFDQVCQRNFRHYYARPETWPSLGYGGPPQPDGFPDHAQPPRT